MENKFAKRLFELRQENKLSQDALAKAIGVTQKSIDFWEKGINEPKLSYLIKLSEYFNITLDYLSGKSDY